MTIRVNVDQADVLVDGRRIGASPLADPAFIEPGSRRLEVRKAGFAPTSQGIEVAVGSAQVVELKLIPVLQSPVVTAQSPRPAPLDTSAPRWRTAGVLGGVGLAAAGAGVGIAFSFVARAKTAAAVTESDRLTSGTLDLDSICPEPATTPRCGRLREILEARGTYRGAAIAGFAMGGVGVAGAVFSALRRPSRPGRSGHEEKVVTIVPSLEGVVITGTF